MIIQLILVKIDQYIEEEVANPYGHTGAHGHGLIQQPGMVRSMTDTGMHGGGYNQQQYYNNHHMQYQQHPQQPYYENFDRYPKFTLDLVQFLKDLQEKRVSVKAPREKIIENVKKFVEELDIIDSSEIYGSYKTELDLPSSDIDFVICSQSTHGIVCLSQLNDKLGQTQYDWIESYNYIGSATIPIIKIDTKMDGVLVKVDITFKDEGHKGNDCVNVVNQYLEIYP